MVHYLFQSSKNKLHANNKARPIPHLFFPSKRVENALNVVCQATKRKNRLIVFSCLADHGTGLISCGHPPPRLVWRARLGNLHHAREWHYNCAQLAHPRAFALRSTWI